MTGNVLDKFDDELLSHRALKNARLKILNSLAMRSNSGIIFTYDLNRYSDTLDYHPIPGFVAFHVHLPKLKPIEVATAIGSDLSLMGR